MNQHHKILTVITFICCSVVISAAADDRAPTAAEIKALLLVNGTGDIANQIGPITAKQTIIALRRVNPNLDPRADNIITEVVVGYMRQQAQRDHVIDRLIPVYSKYLTGEDVRQLMTFYRSPAGKKLSMITPEISTESARIGQEWVESTVPGLQSQLLDRLRREKLIN